MENLNSIDNPIVLVEVSKLNNLFRINAIGVDIAQDGTYIFKASLYSEDHSLSVTWLSDKPRVDLQKGSVVRGGWITKKLFAVGTNIIDTLYSIQSIAEEESLTSIIDPDIIHDKFAYWTLFRVIDTLPFEYRAIINKVLLEEYVLQHFLQSPYSVDDLFPFLGGNLQMTAANVVSIFSENFIDTCKFSREAVLAASILNGIGNYNRLVLDKTTQSYINTEQTNLHNSKRVACDLIQKATGNNDIDKAVLNEVLLAIEELDFDF